MTDRADEQQTVEAFIKWLDARGLYIMNFSKVTMSGWPVATDGLAEKFANRDRS